MPKEISPAGELGRLRVTEIFLHSWWRRWLHAVKLWKTPTRTVQVDIPFEVTDPEQPHMLYAHVGWAGVILTADMVKGAVRSTYSEYVLGYTVEFQATHRNTPVKERKHRSKRGGRFNRQQQYPS